MKYEELLILAEVYEETAKELFHDASFTANSLPRTCLTVQANVLEQMAKKIRERTKSDDR